MAMRRWDEQLIYSDRRTYLPLPSGFSALDPSAEAGAYRSTRLPQRQQSLCRLVFFSASSIKPRLRLQKSKVKTLESEKRHRQCRASFAGAVTI
jgi:hypothetical protein